MSPAEFKAMWRDAVRYYEERGDEAEAAYAREQLTDVRAENASRVTKIWAQCDKPDVK
jgi:hypothetical protein